MSLATQRSTTLPRQGFTQILTSSRLSIEMRTGARAQEKRGGPTALPSGEKVPRRDVPFDIRNGTRDIGRVSLIVGISSNSKDIILAVSPALFGVVGTVLGARAANGAATAERRKTEDDEARARLAAVTESLMIRRSRGTHGAWLRDPALVTGEIRTAVSNARAPLLTAGIDYRTTYLALLAIEVAAAHLEEEPYINTANGVVFFLVSLLDHRRWYRRSRWAHRGLHARLSRPEVPHGVVDMVLRGGVL